MTVTLARQPRHVADISERLALPASDWRTGDQVIQDDIGALYVLMAADPGVDDNWDRLNVQDTVQSVISALDPRFGVVGNGVADDTNALRAWAAAANGKIALWVPGTYRISGPIVFTDVSTQVVGFGYKTKIVPTSNTLSGVVLGDPVAHGGSVNSSLTADANGIAPIGVRVSGGINGLCIETGTNPPAIKTGNIGIQIIDGIQASLKNNTVNGFDIAYDLNGNCYGAQLENNRSTFSQNNVGLNIRFGPANGADQSFVNNWFSGRVAAVHIAGGGGGLHFWGGQLSGGHNLVSAQDGYGVVTIGKDYLTDVIQYGVGNNTFHGCSFEGYHYMWAFRSYGYWSASCINVNFNPDNATAIGILKMTSASSSALVFSACGIAANGPYTNPGNVLADISGQANGSFSLFEENWNGGGNNITVGTATGININTTTLALQAGLTTGCSGEVAGDFYSQGRKIVPVDTYLAGGALSYPIAASQNGLVLDLSAASGTSTPTLPTSTGLFVGWKVTVRKSDSSTNAINVGGNGNTINGSATYSLTVQGETATFEWNGTNWTVVSSSTLSAAGLAAKYDVLPNRRAISGATNAAFNDEIIADSTSAPFAVALPSPANVNQSIVVTNIGTNTVTLTGTVSGQTNPTLAPWASRTIRSTASTLYFA